MYNHIKVIGFDADDTLWENETLFRSTESKFFEFLKHFDVEHRISKELFRQEMENLRYYGYGIKGFMLSMIETAIRVSNGSVSPRIIEKIIALGKEMMDTDIELLPEVETTLTALKPHFRLIMVTKGDLSDQERKLKKSNLEHLFHHIEIVSEKRPENYSKLLQHLDIGAGDFLMIGNSLKSDILPVLEIGANAIHIPFHVTWAHETVNDSELKDKNFDVLSSIGEIPKRLRITSLSV